MPVRPLRTLLVPTDFSPAARRALLRAVSLPLSPRGHVELVHVLPPARGAALATASSRAERHLQRLAAAVQRMPAGERGSPARVRTRLLHGQAHVELIRHAREIDADLVVMARTGEGGRLSRVLGTTAGRVLRMAEMPVLTVARRPVGPYRRPLVALPLDPSARRLVELVLSLTGPRPPRLTALRAYHVAFPGLIGTGPEAAPTDYQRARRDEAQEALQTQLAALRRYGYELDAVLREDDARSAVLAEARRLRADLIALGTHARSGLAHALMGSVAEWVIANATVDVLVARPVRFTFEMP